MMENTKETLYGFEVRVPDERRNPERKTHNIKQLWQRNHEILRLAVLGYNYKDIAEMLDIHPQTVSNTINGDLGQKKLSELRLKRDEDAIDVGKEVARILPLAIKTYENILNNEQESNKLKKEVADTLVMDIAGHRAPAQVQGAFAHAHLIRAEIEQLKERGRAMLNEENCIDITPEK